LKFNLDYNDPMLSTSQHECLIYEGSPPQQFRALAPILDRKLKANYRCLYMASPSMVSEFKSFLGAQGIDADDETGRGNLLLSSTQTHLLGGWQFDVETMIQLISKTLAQALSDGYQGLWATGDMVWEFGPHQDFSKLVPYEVRLENFLRQNANIGGVCQYRADMLPREVVRKGLLVHPRVLVDESSSLLNSWYTPESFQRSSELDSELDSAIDRILHLPLQTEEIMVQLSDSIRSRAEDLANIDGVSLEDFIMFAVAEKIERSDPHRSDPAGKPLPPN
jgi:hypothetical protein